MSPGGRGPTAGIVLAGGHSARMGSAKAWLRWGETTLLGHAIAVVAAAVDRVVVVAAAGQELPALPEGVLLVADEQPDEGPLRAIATGLRALDDPFACAFVCAVDMPFLPPELVTAMIGALQPGVDAAVPRLDGRDHPLAAAYRASLVQQIDALLDAGHRRVGDLLDVVAVRRLAAEGLPGGADALANLNTPADLEAARQAMREKGTGVPTAPGPSSPIQASAVAPASEVTAWEL